MDTIAAISTCRGQAGISVIRISGKKALAVAARVFRPFDATAVEDMAGYTAKYGVVMDSDGEIDDAVMLVFKSPHSYTGEDIVEISCHGGVYISERVLQAAISAGAKGAERGEFTKRAFLAGKLDLSQAESVMELISAQGRQLHRSARAMRKGVLSQKIELAAKDLVSIAGELAAWLDYPDEDIAPVDSKSLLCSIEKARSGVKKLLSAYESGSLLRGGIDTAIIGKPNVGKSTLMNLLAGYERSIVTEHAGTTRDIVQEQVILGDLTLKLSDTAGIRDTENEIELIGVQRSYERIESAQLIIAVFDGSKELNNEDMSIIVRIAESGDEMPCIAIINKCDLPQGIDKEFIRSRFIRTVEISAANGTGIEELTEAITATLKLENILEDGEIIVSQRQRGSLLEALERLDECTKAVQEGVTLDAVGATLDRAIEPLLTLSGKRVSDAVVDEVFARFCVGK